MDSFIAWMSFSESERRRVMDAIDTLRQKDARDELGLGAIRDGFADLFFPGTGTVQTRARYFLFVPWMYRELEAKGRDPAEVARLAREMEIGLIEALEAGGERDGIIGIVARRRLKRLPSNIYWLGMQTWRICQARGGQDDFHRALRRRSPVSLLKNDDGERADGAARGAWHAGLPPKPADFPKKATFALTRREAEYLRERVVTTAPGSLLSFLVREEAGWEPTAFPWEHPYFGSFPADLREALRQARRFSEAMHGASVLYNLLLAEKAESDELVATYREWIEEWAAERRAEAPPPAGPWPDAPFWAMASKSGRATSVRTRGFAREWVDHVGNVVGGAAPDSPFARDLVLRRELEVKGSQKARLHNEAARRLWNGGAGLGRIDYRWRNAQRILLDIHDGLSGAARHA